MTADEPMFNFDSPIVQDNDSFQHHDIAHLDHLYGMARNPLLKNVSNFMMVGKQLGNAHFGDSPFRPERKRRRHWLAGKEDGEVGEFLSADFANDLVEYVDGAIDVSYIAFGGLLEACAGNVECADVLIKEVMRSNDTKLVDCTVREDGKVQKGPHFQPPRVKAILEYFGIEIPEKVGLAKFNDMYLSEATAPNGEAQ